MLWALFRATRLTPYPQADHRDSNPITIPVHISRNLRHSCATLLLVQGVSPRVVMDIRGHSQIGLTMNTYRHVIADLPQDAAQRMQGLLRDQRDRHGQRASCHPRRALAEDQSIAKPFGQCS